MYTDSEAWTETINLVSFQRDLWTTCKQRLLEVQHPEKSLPVSERANKQLNEIKKSIQDIKIEYNKEIESLKKNPQIEIRLERKIMKSDRSLRG